MARIKNIKKSELFGKLADAQGTALQTNQNDIVVVAFGATTGTNRLAGAALNGEQPYVCSYHLRDLYDLKKPDGTFDFDSAFNAFVAEFPIGYEDTDVHLYDFPVSDLIGKKSVKLANGREMQTRRIASYASKDSAFVVAKNDMEKGIGKKYFVE